MPPPSVRLGAHISSAGGIEKSAERARELGCDCYQIFTASPRQWRASPIPAENARELARLRAAYQLSPLVVHANYLINLAGANPEFHARSLTAFRGELERARAAGSEYLVLHPGSSAGSGNHAEAIARCIASIQQAAVGFDWGALTLLIENTAGGGQHLGGSFEEVAQILDGLAGLPAAACIDTCHAWVAGCDLATDEGYQQTIAALAASIGLDRVPVFHVNDAKAARGSHLDRHENIGAGQLGTATFARLLRDPRLQGKAFVLETPLAEPGGHSPDMQALRNLIKAQ